MTKRDGQGTWEPYGVYDGMWEIRDISAKCKSVGMPHANVPDTPVHLTSSPKHFPMLPGPPRAKQSALRLCKRILRCSWKYLQLWMCIQDAKIFDIYDSSILQQLRPLLRSAGDFKTSWDPCAALQETINLVPYFHSGGSKGSITIRHFIDLIHLCYSHKICYIIIWYVLSVKVSIYIHRANRAADVTQA